MFRLVLLIYASLSTFQCCEVFEEEQNINAGGTTHWDYLVNVTELGVAAINGDVKMIETSLKGICVFLKTNICTECIYLHLNQKMVVMSTTMGL